MSENADQHTRTPYPGDGSPDYCAECSNAAEEWVEWPCSRDALVAAVRANESLHRSYETANEQANDCSHMSATGIDQTAVGPGKVWRCDHCGLTYRDGGDGREATFAEPDPARVEATTEVGS